MEKDHGRLETRTYYQSDQLDWFADKDKLEGLCSVGLVEATREIHGKTSVERRYYLCSLKLDVQTFARAVRAHWGVENQVHWVIDVCFREDQSRARTGYAAENLATLRRLALNLLKRETTKKRGIRGKQLNASWDHSYLLKPSGRPSKNLRCVCPGSRILSRRIGTVSRCGARCHFHCRCYLGSVLTVLWAFGGV